MKGLEQAQRIWHTRFVDDVFFDIEAFSSCGPRTDNLCM